MYAFRLGVYLAIVLPLAHIKCIYAHHIKRILIKIVVKTFCTNSKKIPIQNAVKGLENYYWLWKNNKTKTMWMSLNDPLLVVLVFVVWFTWPISILGGKQFLFLSISINNSDRKEYKILQYFLRTVLGYFFSFSTLKQKYESNKKNWKLLQKNFKCNYWKCG